MNDVQNRAHTSKVSGIFTHIAGMYDIYNRIFSLGFDALWRRDLIRLIDPAVSSVRSPVLLDLAAGTLEVTKKLAAKYPEGSVVAADFCPSMLLEGKAKLQEHSPVLPVVADALALPLPDNSVDGITVAFGVRNFKPRHAALSECHRVLKRGGRLCILEFGSTQDKIMFGVYNWYLRNVLPFFGRLLSKDKEAYQYLADTILAFPSADALVEECRAAGFGTVVYHTFTAGIVRIHVCDKE